MPSKRESSARVDYVPALCTHRPSLLPIGCAGEASGLTVGGGLPPPAVGNLVKPSHLEEGEVVTRFVCGMPMIRSFRRVSCTEALAASYAEVLAATRRFQRNHPQKEGAS